MDMLNETTKKVLHDLKDDIDDLLKKGSNIEVIWALEKLNADNAILKSAEYIRKSLRHNK